MLAELWQYLGASTASPGARRLGYAYEAAALEVRHRRCREAWQPHLAATRSALLAAARRLDAPTEVAWIVGGGIVHDLPLTELLDVFQHIVLLDMVFTRPTRRLVRALSGRVTCCYWDATAGVDWLARHRSMPPELIFTSPNLPEHLARPDWLVSVNCLLQLPLLPVAWLQRCGVAEPDLEAFGRQLVRNHLHWLSLWQAPYCLVSEVGDSRYLADGLLVDRTSYWPLLEDFTASAVLTAQWSWQVHPPGELRNRAWETRGMAVWESPAAGSM